MHKYQSNLAGNFRSFLTAMFALMLAFTTAQFVSAAVYGELDNAFQPSLVKDNQAFGNAVLIQPDGKILYAGFFLTINRQPQSHIARFNPDGTLDSTFDTGNTFTFAASIGSIALQSDGKIIVGGSFDKIGGVTRYSVARLNADGTFDPTFNVAFPASVNSVTSVAVQPDGKVLLGGNFSSIGGQTRNGFARVNTDGSLDTGFNTPCSAFSNRSIIVQPDLKILVGSSCSTATSPGVARLNANGTLDTTFDAGTGSNGSAVASLALQPDGRVLVGGQFSSFNGVSRVGIVRLTAVGAVDTTFVPASNYQTNAIALQSDGKLMISRSFGFQGAVPINRLNADGSNDAAFNASETQVNAINSIAVTADGTVYEAGKMIVEGPNFSTIPKPFIRLTATGQIDTTLNPYIVFPSLNAGINNVVVQPDGKILVGGQFSEVNRIRRSALVRFNADGSLDTAFAAIAGVFDGTVNALALQPDGKILVGSSLPNAGTDRLIRLNADGSRDSSFNVVVGDDGDSVKYIGIQPDGKIIVAGTFTVIGGQTRNSHFARLNADGTVDAFNPTFNAQNYVYSLLVQPDGKFIVSGDFSTVNGTNRNATARFNPDGTLDGSFLNTDYGTIPIFAALQPDGKIIVTEFGAVLRFNPNNTQDNSFTSTSFKVTGNNSGSINSVVVQTNGKIVVGGRFDFTLAGGFQARSNYARLNANGTLDAGFGVYDGATGGNVNKVALQPDGKIVLGGVFKMINGFGHSGLARLTPTIFQANRFSDFDGDGLTDASVFRSGLWFVNPSAGPNATPIYGLQFGLASDKIAPSDYDGDGRTDVAVWRENVSGNQAYFYILRSATGTVRIEPFGLTGDTIMPGDWDGDGKADLATYREGVQSSFYYRGSLNNPNGNITFLPWGISGDAAVRGDFDGDGRLDAAVFRSTDRTWYVRSSSNGQVSVTLFGLAADKRVSGDFDGDGKTDIAVFRSGVWYILQSTDRQIRYRNWGIASDSLTAGDYDGDGKTDIAVFRNGVNYVQYSSNSAAIYQPFGAAGDVPIASAYIQ